MRGRAHSDDTKAAVMAALLAGQSISSVAEDYHLGKATVSEWARQIGPQIEQVRTEKPDLASLINAYLNENFTTLTAQARFFRDEKWLREQDASSLAVNHGVLMDKAIRILEAIERASQPAGDPGLDTAQGAAE